ncbi:glutathione S-transferase family protein [Roseovarius sp. LXJ103]|uniref:glutathione S-transferase family protein n=1 Tax=Roseovarius carneus TaxID=2853164 RepID=UPI000D616D16|nr:glutathione S-transferase family protein [Roseovarius carneus]MBZ8119781.1 glutathione S-transferase family protein [Roseovarius carneus]PWE34619.1 glutathione S-transferase [Pelagicola sp. LXJ1103]
MTYLLHYAPDNASLIIRLALEEIGQPYRTILVDRRMQAQRSPAYLKLNPNGLIPVLETPAGPIFETGAILLWLSEAHPGTIAPLPGATARAPFLKWLFFLSNTLHPALRMLFYTAKYAGPEAAHQAALQAQMQAEVQRILALLEGAAAGPFLLGAEPSAADMYLCCMLRWLSIYPKGQTAWFDLGAFPKLTALAAAMEARAATHAAQKAEGLGPTPFTAPSYPNPPEGSAT